MRRSLYISMLLACSFLLTACATIGGLGTASPDRLKQRYALDPYAAKRAIPYGRMLYQSGKITQAAAVIDNLLGSEPLDDMRASDYLLAAQIYGALSNVPEVDEGEAETEVETEIEAEKASLGETLEDDTNENADDSISDIKSNTANKDAEIYSAKQLKALVSAVSKQPLSFHTTGALISYHRAREDYSAAQAIFDRLVNNQDFLNQLPERDFATLIDKAALNLVAMDEYLEAHRLILKAKDRYPDNRSLERNNRILRALVQSHGYNVPKPDRRPKNTRSTQKEPK